MSRSVTVAGVRSVDSHVARPRRRSPLRTILFMQAMMVIPAAIALSTVVDVRPMVSPALNPSPYGYTWSLVFFIVPFAVLGVWFHRRVAHRHGGDARAAAAERKSFWMTYLVLVSLGFILDGVFGAAFFAFPNPAATLGIQVPVVGGTVPVEEFAFYATGFGAILLTYIWSDVYWLGEYRRRVAGQGRPVAWGQLVSVHRTSIVAGVLLFAMGFAWKKLGPHDWQAGFPGYYLFLLVCAILPNMVFFRAVRDVINWEAVNFTALLLLPISLLWEGVLAVPYGWWGYQPSQMVGIYVAALTGLPIEAMLLWLVIGYTGVTFYEVIRLRHGLSTETIG